MRNPFQYGKVVGDPYFTDREQELVSLISDVENRHNLVLYSPRRYGKTSLLKKLSAQIEKRGMGVIFIDFMKVTSQEDFIELYARELFRKTAGRPLTILKKLAALVSGLRPALETDPTGNLSLTLQFKSDYKRQRTLEEVLNLSEKLDAKRRWLVIFDEFQEVLKLGGEGFVDILRSVIQHHQRSTYIFCGSRYHILLELFNSPQKAFYRFGKIIPLQKIAPDIMEDFLIQRFADTKMQLTAELAKAIIELSDNIPNYVQFLAAELWQLAQLFSQEPSQELLNKALEAVLNNQSDYFLQIWGNLSPQQKRLVAALSQDQNNPFSQEYHDRFQLGAISSSQRAMQKLISEQIVNKENGTYSFGDPLFKLFVISRLLASTA